MLVKIYKSLWGLIAVNAGVLFLTGNLGEKAAIAIGLACIGMIFMGMIAILPFSVSHPPHGKH